MVLRKKLIGIREDAAEIARSGSGMKEKMKGLA
jgi:hypothetical protein